MRLRRTSPILALTGSSLRLYCLILLLPGSSLCLTGRRLSVGVLILIGAGIRLAVSSSILPASCLSLR